MPLGALAFLGAGHPGDPRQRLRANLESSSFFRARTVITCSDGDFGRRKTAASGTPGESWGMRVLGCAVPNARSGEMPGPRGAGPGIRSNPGFRVQMHGAAGADPRGRRP